MRLLHLDDHYVAVDKPAGVLVHRTGVAAASDPGVYALQLVRDQLGARVYPIHRLDRPTSGALIFGRSSEAASRLAAAFRERSVDKRYVAIVRGFAPESAIVTTPVPANERRGAPLREAESALRRLATAELPIAVGRYPSARYSLVELRPRSGRWHQLRRHCAHLRHPIVGDTNYGDGAHNRLFRGEFECHRLCLVAASLAFVHPYTGAAIELRAAPDEALTRALTGLGWGWPTPRPE